MEGRLAQPAWRSTGESKRRRQRARRSEGAAWQRGQGWMEGRGQGGSAVQGGWVGASVEDQGDQDGRKMEWGEGARGQDVWYIPVRVGGHQRQLAGKHSVTSSGWCNTATGQVDTWLQPAAGRDHRRSAVSHCAPPAGQLCPASGTAPRRATRHAGQAPWPAEAEWCHPRAPHA